MKKILTLILTILLTISPILALEDGSARQELKNYGVNKKWTIDERNLSNVLRTPLVDANKKIHDYSEILTKEEKETLTEQINAFIEHTHMDMVILTVDMAYTYESQNEDYAADFYDYNDFGINFDKYSGVILLRNTYSADPYFNVYTFGEAQLYYDFDRCENMLDDIYPYLSLHDYLKGFELFISDFTRDYDRGVALPNYYVDDMGYIHQKYVMPIIPALLGGLIVSAITIIVMVKKNKMVKKATEANDYVDKSNIVFNTRTDVMTGSFTTHYTIQHDSGGSGGGGHSSHSGSSGGGHGGGGGRHG